MIRGGRGAGLIAEPPLQLAVMGQMGRQEFQRDAPAELRVERFVYDSHAAGADLLLDVVVGDNLSRELQRSAWSRSLAVNSSQQFHCGPIENLAVRILRKQPLRLPTEVRGPCPPALLNRAHAPNGRALRFVASGRVSQSYDHSLLLLYGRKGHARN